MKIRKPVRSFFKPSNSGDSIMESLGVLKS